MRVLIDTIPRDEHAAAVAWLLRQRGLAVDFLFRSDFPVIQKLTLKIGSAGSQLLARAEDGLTETCDYGVAITRRHRGPIVSDGISEADRAFAKRQAWIVNDAVPSFIRNVGMWVNPLERRAVYASKPMQLKTAVESGLHIPETLISNDPELVRTFLNDAGGDIICKPLQPAAWSGTTTRVTLTTKVTGTDLDRYGDTIRHAPMIFQHYVSKAFEARVVVMGRTCIAAKVGSASGREVIDWRACYTDGEGLAIQVVEVPREVQDRIFSFMDAIGLVFGSLDFCIDPDGRWIFLEVNPMGQFLWLDRHPDLPLLSIFCDFIQSADPRFEHRGPPSDDVRFYDVMVTEGYRKIFASYADHRRDSNDPFTYVDHQPEDAV